MHLLQRMTIPAAEGRAVYLQTGQCLRVINTYGTQVVDTWAFSAQHPSERLSMGHCREVLQRIRFEPGDRLMTNLYRPILSFTADTSPGGHDTLIPACSRETFINAGCQGYHANCTDNLKSAVRPHGIDFDTTPDPWNLFMLAPVSDGRNITYIRPTSAPGDYVELKAELDCIMAFSACPDDVYPTNGGDGRPRDVHIEIFQTDSER